MWQLSKWGLKLPVPDGDVSLPDPKATIAEDARSQPPSPLEFKKLLGSRADGDIHPVARPTLFGARKENPVDFEFALDELAEIDPRGDNISPYHREGEVMGGTEVSQLF